MFSKETTNMDGRRETEDSVEYLSFMLFTVGVSDRKLAVHIGAVPATIALVLFLLLMTFLLIYGPTSITESCYTSPQRRMLFLIPGVSLTMSVMIADMYH